jgi:CheY-like chemotaxis protein
LNLLVNSAQAIEEGDVENNEIAVRTWTDEAHVFAEVADSGRGIPKDNLKQLFDPFFTTKPPGVGSGLGLSICHNYVSSYGGRIDVESEAGKGSRFIVVLPVYSEERHRQDPVREPEEKTSRQPLVPRGRILVVDDEPMIGSTMKRILRRDHDVTSATSGLEGKDILENDPSFNLILCDLMMPDFSGMDLYAWVQEKHPQLSDRIVFITGGAFTPMANEFLQRIDNPRLEKPFDPEDLKATIGVLFGRLGNAGENATGK